MTHASIPASSQSGVETNDQVTALTARVRGGASWFYWIAALSIVNSIVVHMNGEWGFALGMGVTQVFDAIAIAIGEASGGSAGTVATVVAIAFDLVAASVMALFGFLASREKAWAFVIGAVFYALDGVIFVIAGDLVGIGFHAFALFFVISGFLALRQLRALRG
ncbi:MAG: hypothetical protein HC882_09105 [Acidobacteria bacterium]|nr:hypothetical protein [Acidobacteriota bacterium]